MPELITKYPDTVLGVLSGVGAQCGKGVPPQILKQCPPARFCATSSGELCVYGIDEIPSMTQISAAELAPVVCATSQRSSGDCATAPGGAGSKGAGTIAPLVAVGLVVMLAIRRPWLRGKRSRRANERRR